MKKVMKIIAIDVDTGEILKGQVHYEYRNSKRVSFPDQKKGYYYVLRCNDTAFGSCEDNPWMVQTDSCAETVKAPETKRGFTNGEVIVDSRMLHIKKVRVVYSYFNGVPATYWQPEEIAGINEATITDLETGEEIDIVLDENDGKYLVLENIIEHYLAKEGEKYADCD